MTMRAIALGLLIAGAAAAGAARPAPAPAPAAVGAGPLIVVAAPRHPTVTNAQAAFRADDPQLVGRLVAFDGAAVSFDGGAKECARATRTSRRVALGALLRQLFPDRPNYGKTYVTRPADFGLSQSAATTVTAIRFRCVTPRTHGADWNGATLFPIGGGRWALSLFQDHLLILRPGGGPIQASFDCAKARAPVERTICGDRLLAGWDRSVAAAYQEGNGDQAEQRAWIAERDKCGSDRQCLQESMSLRTTNLLH